MPDSSSLKCGKTFIPSDSGYVERGYLLISKKESDLEESLLEVGTCWPHKKSRKSQKVYPLTPIMRSETSLTCCWAARKDQMEILGQNTTTQEDVIARMPALEINS